MLEFEKIVNCVPYVFSNARFSFQSPRKTDSEIREKRTLTATLLTRCCCCRSIPGRRYRRPSASGFRWCQ